MTHLMNEINYRDELNIRKHVLTILESFIKLLFYTSN